jgi:hypothetical protein
VPATFHVRVVLGPLHRDPHVDLCREMEAHLDAVEMRVERLADVRFFESSALGYVLPLAGREIVEYEHLVAAGQERFDDVRADKPRAACHDRPQGSYPRPPTCS